MSTLRRIADADSKAVRRKPRRDTRTRIQKIRLEIAKGTYESDRKLDAAIENLVLELGLRVQAPDHKSNTLPAAGTAQVSVIPTRLTRD